MNDNLDIDMLLDNWANAFSNEPTDITSLIIATRDLVSFLCIYENNTDVNCRKVNDFVFFKILGKDILAIPEDLKGIIIDMGQNLHDTHTYPDIAENFESTPYQLLKRIESMIKKE